MSIKKGRKGEKEGSKGRKKEGEVFISVHISLQFLTVRFYRLQLKFLGSDLSSATKLLPIATNFTFQGLE
jgi:hypothetical protein